MKILTLLLLTTTIAGARVYETYEECVKRYGKPEIGKGRDTSRHTSAVWEKDDFYILISFLDNHAVAIQISKHKKSLSDGETKSFLAIYNKQWKEDESYRIAPKLDKRLSSWISSDGKMVASLYLYSEAMNNLRGSGPSSYLEIVDIKGYSAFRSEAAKFAKEQKKKQVFEDSKKIKDSGF